MARGRWKESGKDKVRSTAVGEVGRGTCAAWPRASGGRSWVDAEAEANSETDTEAHSDGDAENGTEAGSEADAEAVMGTEAESGTKSDLEVGLLVEASLRH